MNDLATRLSSLKQLLHLRKLRIKALEAAVQEAQANVEQALREVTARQERIDSLLEERLDVMTRRDAAQGVSLQAVCCWAQSKRERLSERVERNEWLLQEDLVELQVKRQALHAARVALLKARQGEDAIESLEEDTRSQWRREIDSRAEAEAEEVHESNSRRH
jgi:hypothetical protein